MRNFIIAFLMILLPQYVYASGDIFLSFSAFGEGNARTNTTLTNPNVGDSHSVYVWIDENFQIDTGIFLNVKLCEGEGVSFSAAEVFNADIVLSAAPFVVIDERWSSNGIATPDVTENCVNNLNAMAGVAGSGILTSNNGSGPFLDTLYDPTANAFLYARIDFTIVDAIVDDIEFCCEIGCGLIVDNCQSLQPDCCSATVSGDDPGGDPGDEECNLLSNADFEQPLAGGFLSSIFNFPYVSDAWGTENATVVGTQNGISPNSGTMMMRMEPANGSVTQAMQRVDISEFAEQIDAGCSCVNFCAFFNTLEGGSGAFGGIDIFYIPGTLSGNLVDSSIGQSFGRINLDGNVDTWEKVTIENATIPVGTRSLLVQILFDNPSLNTNPVYADTSELCLCDCKFESDNVLCDLDDIGMPTGDYVISGTFTNLQDIPGTHLLLPPNAVSPAGAQVCFGNGQQTLLLDSPLNNGDSFEVGSDPSNQGAIRIKNAMPGDEVCFTMILLGDNGVVCCDVEVCFVMPPCDCLQVDRRFDQIQVVNADPLDVSYTFQITNLYGQDVYHAFLAPLGNANFDPDFFDLVALNGGNPLGQGESVSVTTSVTGVPIDELVEFLVTIHVEDFSECCSRMHDISFAEFSSSTTADGSDSPPALPGDMNNDGVVDLLDIAPFVEALSNAEYVAAGDANQDGLFDLTDVAPFVVLLSGT